MPFAVSNILCRPHQILPSCSHPLKWHPVCLILCECSINPTHRTFQSSGSISSQCRFYHQFCGSFTVSDALGLLYLWPPESCCWFSFAGSFHHSHISSTPALILSAFLCLTQSLGHHDRLVPSSLMSVLALPQSSSADWTCRSLSCWFQKSELDSRRFGCRRCHSHCCGHLQWH